MHVGPAHTPGDTLVHVPEDKVVFTGGILFIEGHPIMWEGPVSNWVDACNRIMAMDVETVVPGHGPITDKKGVAAVRDYLLYIEKEARKRFDAGLSAFDAAADINLSDYDSWVTVNASSSTSLRSTRNSQATRRRTMRSVCWDRWQRSPKGKDVSRHR